MTKHQAISLKLAQWLGHDDADIWQDSVWMPNSRSPDAKSFNPFAPTTEGRAQFAECVIKGALDKEIGLDLFRNAVRSGWDLNLQRIGHDNTPEGITAATLEAIYYAIGGTAGEWE